MSTDSPVPEDMAVLGTMAIPGERLATPNPSRIYNVFELRDGDSLVLRVTEKLNSSQDTGSPRPIGDVRVDRGELPRVLDVLREVANVLARVPEMGDRLNNLEPPIPNDAGSWP